MGFALSDMALSSPTFRHGEPIPKEYSGEGQNISPALRWSDAPTATQGYAIICHDPDAPLVNANGTYGFVHWVLYNIPASVHEITEGSTQFTAGMNSANKKGYTGPMPPTGHGIHNYYFWVLALKEQLDLESNLTLWDFLKRVEPVTIGMNRIVGTYERR